MIRLYFIRPAGSETWIRVTAQDLKLLKYVHGEAVKITEGVAGHFYVTIEQD